MRRIAHLTYSGLAYLAFLLPIGYLVGFLADLGVPRTINRGAGPLGPPLAVDLALLLVFGVQHSVMARPAFKRFIHRWIPPALERSTYVLSSGLVLSLLFWLWRPVPAVLWDLHGTGWEPLAWAGFLGGWAVAVASTFALNHLYLFGLAQVMAWARGAEPPEVGLRTPFLYKVVRHPMTAGLLLVFWSTPRMTVGHLLFAAGMTAYSLLATIFEERDLLRDHPVGYREYRRRVPGLIPFLRPGILAPSSGRLRWEISLLAAGVGWWTVLLLRGGGVSPAGAESVPSVEEGVVSTAGGRRTYGVFVPSTPAKGSRPLVLALHGTGGNGRRLRTFLGGALEREARERGWIVAYPDALEGAWNDCRTQVASRAREEGVSDIAFLETLIHRLEEERGADPDSVFLLGYSGGGHMALRVALEKPGLVRGLAVFGASLPTREASLCRSRGTAPPLLIVDGRRDLINPFGGGVVLTPDGTSLGPVRSAQETTRYFKRISRDPNQVVLLAVQGGGHTVPGPDSRFPRLAGPTVRSLHGVEEALDFFARAQSGGETRVVHAARGEG